MIVEEEEQSPFDPKRLRYQALLWQLPENQLSAWMQVGRNDLESLQAWIDLCDSIDGMPEKPI